MKFLCFSLLLFCLSLNAHSSNDFIRTIEVRVALDSALEDHTLWKEKVQRAMAKASKVYEDEFNIQWKVKEFVLWRQKRKNCAWRGSSKSDRPA